jgi:hypothetical protein
MRPYLLPKVAVVIYPLYILLCGFIVKINVLRSRKTGSEIHKFFNALVCGVNLPILQSNVAANGVGRVANNYCGVKCFHYFAVVRRSKHTHGYSVRSFKGSTFVGLFL